VSLFDWGKDENNPPPVVSGSSTGVPPVSDLQANQAREAARAEFSTSQTRRGRPRKSTADGGGNQQSVSPELQAEIARQLEACYDPTAWGALLASPGDVALAMTGREEWNISKDERKTLGATGAAAARTLMISNPRTLALLMLSSALFSVYVPRITKEVIHQKAKKAHDEPKKD